MNRHQLLCVLVFCVSIAAFGCCRGQPDTISKETPSTLSSVQEESVVSDPPKITPMHLPPDFSETRTKPITHVMLHFSSSVVKKPDQPYVVEDIVNIFKDYGVSCHYLIARDGVIYRLVEDDRVAYHAGKGSLDGFPEYTDRLNQYSIGIELLAIGTEEEMSAMLDRNVYRSLSDEWIGYTEAQYTALEGLLSSLTRRYPEIKMDRTHIVGHDEYAKGRKSDPGSLFDWTKIGLTE